MTATIRFEELLTGAEVRTFSQVPYRPDTIILTVQAPRGEWFVSLAGPNIRADGRPSTASRTLERVTPFVAAHVAPGFLVRCQAAIAAYGAVE